MNIKHLALVANGILSAFQYEEIRNCDYIIGVDRAAYSLLGQGIGSNLALGDFDSVTKKEMNDISKNVGDIKTYSSQKDKTDLELAVEESLTLKPERITLFGATGKRFDHMLSGVFLLEVIHAHAIPAEIIDDHNRIMVEDHEIKLQKDVHYPYTSIIPFRSDAVVTLEGFLYPLNHEKLSFGTSMGVSNEIIKKSATVFVHEGIVLVVRSRDGK